MPDLLWRIVPIAGNHIWGATIHLIEILETSDHMLGFGPSELIYPDKARGPVNDDEKVDFLAITEDLLRKVC